MPLSIIRGDITTLQIDAIVNAANNTLLGGGGVDGAIHTAAGPGLLEECKTLHGCATGYAKITGGYNLPCRHVIHTVGPVYRDGCHGEPELLASCYRSALLLAIDYDCKPILFPVRSAGVYGYPKKSALDIAVYTIQAFIQKYSLAVDIVIFDTKLAAISNKYYTEIVSLKI